MGGRAWRKVWRRRRSGSCRSRHVDPGDRGVTSGGPVVQRDRRTGLGETRSIPSRQPVHAVGSTELPTYQDRRTVAGLATVVATNWLFLDTNVWSHVLLGSP